MRCRSLHGLANPAYLGGFLCSALLRVAPYCVPSGVRSRRLRAATFLLATTVGSPRNLGRLAWRSHTSGLGSQVGGPVHVDDGTRHVIRGLRGQKRHRPRDLLRGGDTPEGALRANTLSLGATQQGFGHVGLDEARGDHVEEDAVRRERLGQGLAHGVQAGLARTVSRGLGLPAEGPARGDVHHAPAAALHHDAGSQEGQVRRTYEVRRDRPGPRVLPTREVDLRNGVGLEDGRVVDENVYPTHLARDALDEAARGVRVGYVSREGRVRPTLKGGECLLGRVPVCAVVDRHPRALLRELARYLASYAARGARHKCHLPRKFHPFPHQVASPIRAGLSPRGAALPLVAGASRKRQPKAETPASATSGSSSTVP